MKEKKKTVQMRDLINKYQTNCDRIRDIADLCEKEKRERTDAETKEYEVLMRDNQLLGMKMQAATADQLRENPNTREDAVKVIRENVKDGKKTELVFVRDMMMVSDAASGAIIPLNIQDILKPLNEGFILDKVGLPMPTGLAGDYVWPMYEMVEATICDEGAALTDTKIPFSKLTANPERMGIAIPVTNQSLNQSAGILETIIREIMPLSIRLLLNKILFSTKLVNNATNLKGPFVDLLPTALPLSPVPTFIELNSGMKAAVLSTGVDGEHMCWIMSKSMEAIFEGTPINEKGIFVPMAQNHIMCGLPIYTTNTIASRDITYQKYTASSKTWAAYTMTKDDKADYQVTGDTAAHALAKVVTPADGKIAEITVVTEYIGLGDWRYQPMGLFGTLRFIVDPYSQARKDAVDFVLNTDYGTKTLRPEAFMLGKVAPSPDAVPPVSGVNVDPSSASVAVGEKKK